MEDKESINSESNDGEASNWRCAREGDVNGDERGYRDEQGVGRLERDRSSIGLESVFGFLWFGRIWAKSLLRPNEPAGTSQNNGMDNCLEIHMFMTRFVFIKKICRLKLN